ncbi:hypothetical protein WG66_003388, partial [Moniliophthora roreri]
MATDQLQEPRFLGAPRSLLESHLSSLNRCQSPSWPIFGNRRHSKIFIVPRGSFACRRCDSSPCQRCSHDLCHRPKCPQCCGSCCQGKICSAFETSLTTVLLYPTTTNIKLKN